MEKTRFQSRIRYSQDDVCICFISPDGRISSTSEPDTLYIVLLEDTGDDTKQRAYLQVGSWIYALELGVTPRFQTEYNAFILPDTDSTVEGSAIGIILPPDSDKSVQDFFLHGVVMRVAKQNIENSAEKEETLSYSGCIARGLVEGAQYLSSRLVQGAEKTGEFINYGTPKIIDRLTPEDNQSAIDPEVRFNLKVAKRTSGAAVRAIECLSSQIGSATSSFGCYLAPHVKEHSTRILSNTWNMSERETSQKLSSILEVAAGACEGFSTVYEGLTKSAGIIASNLADNTVKVVEHKYGTNAGEAVGDTLQTVGNVFVAGRQMKKLTPLGIIKTTTKGTSTGIIQNYKK